jgi:hypothetical protein
MRTKGLLVAAALAALAGTALGFAVARAQSAITVPMAPTLNREPGLTGQTVITPLGNNQFRVEITINGLKPNDDRAAHIHSPGSDTSDPAGCDTGGPVVYPLSDVKADASGKGTSVTTVTLDPSKGIPGPGWYVNVHQGAAPNVGPGVICGKIMTSLAGVGGAAPSQQVSAQKPAAQMPAAAQAPAAPARALPATGTGGAPTSQTGLIALLGLAALMLTGAGVALARKR